MGKGMNFREFAASIAADSDSTQMLPVIAKEFLPEQSQAQNIVLTLPKTSPRCIGNYNQSKSRIVFEIHLVLSQYPNTP